jgi:hydrogenase maturation factor
MCASTVGRVLSIEDDQAVVEIDGVRRHALALLTPDLMVGDLVLVGLGYVLGRVDPADLDALVAATEGTPVSGRGS